MRLRAFSPLLLAIVIVAGSCVGCGGGVEPDVPATLTPEKEQEILEQVEGTASQEQGKV